MNRFRSLSTILIVTALLGATGASAQGDGEYRSRVQVSLFPPMSTNGTRAAMYTNDFSFNILAGVSQNERAFALAGLTNIVRGDATGFLSAGLANIVGGQGRAVQFAGLTNLVGGDHVGAQFGGLVNVARDVDGAQFGGLVNVACDVEGAQFAGLANVAGDVRGLQIGGLFNVAKNVRGVQMAGLFNVARRSDYPIGIVNVIKEGEMGVAVGYNEIGTTSLTLRSGGRVLYGIIGLGYNHRAPRKEAASIMGGYGAHINIVPWLRINNELTVESIGIFSNHSDTFKAGYALLPAFRPVRQIEIFGGPSINFMQSNVESMFDIFPDNYIRRREIVRRDGTPKMQQLFVGWQAGAQFIF